jgi:DNA-binding PucR family transcriptional regulator
MAARLADQAQASALGKPAPEQRTVVEDRSKAGREEALRRAEEAAQKLEAATDEEEKASIRQQAPATTAVSDELSIDTLKEFIGNPRVTKRDKEIAQAHLDDMRREKSKEVASGKVEDLIPEAAYNFLVAQARKTRFLRTESPAATMAHEKVKAVVAGIVAKWKNAP